MIVLILILCLATSCISTEVIGYEPHEQAVDTMAKKERLMSPKPPKPPKDTTETPDTIRVPIGFNPTVADWDELTEKTTL